MSLVDLHRRAVEGFDRNVQAVRDDQWSEPTPCSNWSVRDLVNHIVNEDRWTPELLAKKTIEDVGNRFDGDLLGDDPKGSWENASKEALNAVQAEGALEGVVNVSWGQIPATEYVGQLFLDHLVHGWDLASAIGADTKLDPELVEACYAEAKEQEELIRASGAFGSQVDIPEDASTQTKLLALLGRSG